jgi:hypothetical protein
MKDKCRKPAVSSEIIPPIELVQTFNVHLEQIFENFPQKLYEYLNSFDQVLNLYKCGRPLLYDVYVEKKI